MLKKAKNHLFCSLLLAGMFLPGICGAQSLDSLTFNLSQLGGINPGGNVTSFSLAGMGIDGSNNAVDVFELTIGNRSNTSLSGNVLKVSVFLNNIKIYEAWSTTFPLAANDSLARLNSSEFFNRNFGTHSARSYQTVVKMNEEQMKDLGITNLISSPSGRVRMEFVLSTSLGDKSPTGPHTFVEYNIVTVPEITILGPRGTLTADAAPWFRWQSVLDGLIPEGDKRYYLNIYGPNGFSGNTITGDPIFSRALLDNNLLYPVSEAPQLVPGELYAWQVVAVRSGPQNTGEDLSLKSELVKIGYPAADGSAPTSGGGDQNPPPPPADPAAQEAAVTEAVKKVEDMINGLKNGETFNPESFTKAMDELNDHFDTDIQMDGESVRIYEAAEMINRMIGGGYGDVSVAIQVDATKNDAGKKTAPADETKSESGKAPEAVPVLNFPDEGFILKKN